MRFCSSRMHAIDHGELVMAVVERQPRLSITFMCEPCLYRELGEAQQISDGDFPQSGSIFEEAVRNFRFDLARREVSRCGSIPKAAKSLGVSVYTLYRILKGMRRGPKDAASEAALTEYAGQSLK